MKRISVYLIIFIFIFPVFIVTAEGYKNKESQKDVPAGMKKIRQGSVTILVPEGQEVTKTGSATTMESFEQYVVKRFLAAEARVAKLEENQKSSAREIKQLKQLVGDLRKTVTELKQKSQAGQENAPEVSQKR